MLLSKLYTGLVSVVIAGAIGGTSATPVAEGFGGGMVARGDPPKVFYYDPPHLPALQDIVVPKVGACNMLLSVRKIGAAETSVFAFPACNLPPDGSSASIDNSFGNLTLIDNRLYGDLLLLEGIPRDEDKAKLVSGATLSSIEAGELTHWKEGGMGGFGRKWQKVPYKGDTKFTFKGKEGSLFGPYPNPYRLDIGENFPKDKPLDELRLPLKANSDGSTVMFIYDSPPPA